MYHADTTEEKATYSVTVLAPKSANETVHSFTEISTVTKTAWRVPSPLQVTEFVLKVVYRLKRQPIDLSSDDRLIRAVGIRYPSNTQSFPCYNEYPTMTVQIRLTMR